MLKTIIVDDERRARENLKILLTKYCAEDIELVGESDNVEKAFDDILTLKPQLIFLDIDMGNATGFDLLSKFTNCPFKVIFVTGFDQHAIQAIKFSAIDYLLKPVAVEDLQKAVEKAKRVINLENESHFNSMFENLKNPRQKSKHVAIPVLNGYRLLHVDQIMYCEAQKDYTFIGHENGETICSSLNLGEYENLLQDYDFFRVHHSYIINRQYIRNYIRGEGGEIVINQHHRIPVSRRKKVDFLSWLTTN
ncbi:MAG: response regulator transcription factor [Bacteroidetes bacterium]|nr:MAG: response regulator transcription factor [Bacteroidota bacterium]